MKDSIVISQKPTLSVVMATYNGERFIAEAIQSVLDQSFSDFEFIIVDDGSTDETLAIISSFDDPRMLCIKKEVNTGIANSLNLGLSNVKGRFIARMDDDDICDLNRFEEQLRVFENYPEIDVCGSNVRLCNGSVKKYPECHESIKMALMFSNCIIHPTIMMRNSILDQNPYQKDMVPSEDYDLWSRLIWKARFYTIQKPLLFYRQHQFSATSQRRKEQLNLNVLILLKFFEQIGFHDFKNHEYYVKIYASKDYSISGIDLKGLQKWFDYLKRINTKQAEFSILEFNDLVDWNLRQFLIRYFSNRRLIKKVKPFFYLSFQNQRMIISYYVKKLV